MIREVYLQERLRRRRNERKNVTRIIAREAELTGELFMAGKALRSALIFGVWSDNPGSPGSVASTVRNTDLGIMATEIAPGEPATLAISLRNRSLGEGSIYTKITSLVIGVDGSVLATESVVDATGLGQGMIPQSKNAKVSLSVEDLNQIKTCFIDADPAIKPRA